MLRENIVECGPREERSELSGRPFDDVKSFTPDIRKEIVWGLGMKEVAKCGR
jgi:hypothetical protein